MTSPPEGPPVPEQLHAATQRLVRTVDGLADGDFSAPSLLPGWSRAHVVAHLMLNAEALAGVLEGARSGHEVPMYPSQAQRESDIEECAGINPGALRERLMENCFRVDHAVTELTEDLYDFRVRRTPESEAAFTAGRVGEMRLREVEIHHADLGTAYSWADWPAPFCRLLLGSRTKVYQGPPLVAHADDLDEEFVFGRATGSAEALAEGPTVISGPAGLLAWWSTGRNPGDGLTSEGGIVPWMEAW